ncbi:MAG: hypothetical protein ACAI34_14100, partial [Verrucomicrobium sp.]
LGVLKSHGELHELIEDDQVEPELARLKPHLEELLKDGAHDLSGLTHRELHQLTTSLKALGVTGPEQTLTAEIRNREMALQQAYTAALLEVTQAVNGGDYVEVLTALKEFSKVEDEVRTAWMQLGRKLDDPDAIYRWREEQGALALAGVSDEDLSDVFKSVQTKEMRAFIETLIEGGERFAAYDETDLRHDELADLLNNLGTNLGRVREKVEVEVERRGLPGLEKPGDYPAQKDLSRAGREAIKNELGIEVGRTEGLRLVKGTVPDGGFGRLKLSIESPRSGTEVDQAQFYGGGDLGVSEIFKRDLERGIFKYKDPDGVVRSFYEPPVIPQDATPEDVNHFKDAALTQALTRLNEFFGNDPEMLWTISQYAHQGTAACFQYAMASPTDGFIRLENGTPMMLLGNEHKSFTFERKPEGGFRAQFHQSIEEVTHYYSPDGTPPVEVEQDQSSFSLGFALDFAPDRSMSLVGRPEFEYALKPKTWLEPYPKPENIGDVLTSASQELRQDFRAFAVERRAEENLNFLEDHARFVAAPTLEGARELARKYVGEGSEFHLNLDDAFTEPLLEALNGPGAGQLTGPDLIHLFAGGYVHIVGLLELAILPGFIAAHTTKV